MFIYLNGPLGVGKSSLGEALSESIEQSVFLDGDHIVATNPEPDNQLELLHSSIGLLVSHLRDYGYRHFIICHYWDSPEALENLNQHLVRAEPAVHIRCFLAWLSLDENLARIHRRQASRAIDELDHDLETVANERRVLSKWRNGEVGELFDVSAPVTELVADMLERLEEELGS